jgi:hypothetical protein
MRVENPLPPFQLYRNNTLLPSARARSAVGLGITFFPFYSYNVNILTQHFPLVNPNLKVFAYGQKGVGTKCDATRRYSTLLDATSLLDATPLFDAIRHFSATRRYSTLLVAT